MWPYHQGHHIKSVKLFKKLSKENQVKVRFTHYDAVPIVANCKASDWVNIPMNFNYIYFLNSVLSFFRIL